MGLPFEQTFAGLLACDWRQQGAAVWNLGVQSYSPLIYGYRVRDAVDKMKVKPRDVFVFLDVSDIVDEGCPTPRRTAASSGPNRCPAVPRPKDLSQEFGTYLLSNSVTGALAMMLRTALQQRRGQAMTNHSRGEWPNNPGQMKAFGERGLALAAEHMGRVVGDCKDWNCRLTLIVYPWPNQIAHDDRDSIQLRFWRDWAQRNGVRFIDGFAPFFARPKDLALHDLYLTGDVHFSAEGHRLMARIVADAVKAAGGLSPAAAAKYRPTMPSAPTFDPAIAFPTSSCPASTASCASSSGRSPAEPVALVAVDDLKTLDVEHFAAFAARCKEAQVGVVVAAGDAGRGRGGRWTKLGGDVDGRLLLCDGERKFVPLLLTQGGGVAVRPVGHGPAAARDRARRQPAGRRAPSTAGRCSPRPSRSRHSPTACAATTAPTR